MAFYSSHADSVRLPLNSKGSPGYRWAQLGAVHSIVSHFWRSTKPALVVMPTGSGKTAVMQTAALLLRSSRVLVVVPSKLLREQIADEFSRLHPLVSIGALEEPATRPAVNDAKQRVRSDADWSSLADYDVVVATAAAGRPALADVSDPPPDLFDLVMFDEAHHAPARTWSAVADAFPDARQVLFTATPFRNDSRAIVADLIFSYSIAEARRDGIFGSLEFTPVAPKDGQTNDEAIAIAAATELTQDRTSGLDHCLLVRAEGKRRADQVAEVYRNSTSVRLRRIHSGLSARTVRKAIDALRSGDQTPSSGSRWHASAHGPRARAPSCDHARRSSAPHAVPSRPAHAAATCAVSRACSRSWLPPS